MAKTKLFEAWSFRLQQPAPFDDPKYAGSKSMGFSQYNTSSTAQKSTLHAPTMRALLAYAKLVSATENGQSVDGLGAIGHQGTTYRISEYRSANKTDCVVFNPVTGKFNAAQVEDGTQALKPYSVGAGNGTGSGLLFCLMPVLNEDDEFRQKFQEFVSLLESGWADMDAAFECALTLCDNVYRRMLIYDQRKDDTFMSINRGDIFYVNPSETVGSEQRSGRPAIIVSNPLCNEHSPVVEVVYLTCQYKKPMPTHVRIESAGKRSTALCEQISSVDVSRLGDFKGHLTDREMAQVDVALMASLDLHPIPRQAKVRPVGPDVDDAALALIALRFLEGFLQKRCGVTVQDRLSIDLLGQKQR